MRQLPKRRVSGCERSQRGRDSGLFGPARGPCELSPDLPFVPAGATVSAWRAPGVWPVLLVQARASSCEDFAVAARGDAAPAGSASGLAAPAGIGQRVEAPQRGGPEHLDPSGDRTALAHKTRAINGIRGWCLCFGAPVKQSPSMIYLIQSGDQIRRGYWLAGSLRSHQPRDGEAPPPSLPRHTRNR